ncbi:serine dehydratase beta chain [Paenibacillus glycinis]|uniref:serine dehydratase beta chain n=1 Tax=Paenibacillus glycinis TaxID=2697035 RepID=UPI001F19B5DC|nr:serine dehydratase beta chain [Paenibacillus glycinis]
MRFKDVFSIIGPPMIGPSSSHTAGAARIGRAARQLFGGLPRRADVIFYGSFAATYEGHGTYAAIVGGLLDMATDDVRLPDSLELAAQSGMHVDVGTGTGLFPLPTRPSSGCTTIPRTGTRHSRSWARPSAAAISRS